MRRPDRDFNDGETNVSRRGESVISSPAYVASAFARAVAKDVLDHFARAATPVQCSARSRLAKFWCRPPDTVHYELWLHERRNLIELGLHFEDNPAFNARLLAYFSGCLLEIQEELGDSVWVEDWDKGWTRLYEVRPMLPLNDERVADTAARMCEMIQCLQPYLDRFFVEESTAPI